MTVSDITNPAVMRTLQNGGLVVAKTDTIYGVLASVEVPTAVKILYDVRKRDHDKPCIVLVSSMESIPNLSNEQKKEYQRLNEKRPTSIIVNVPGNFMPNIPKNNGTLAFRMIRQGNLKKLISSLGPILAPSANTQGKPPAKNIAEAKRYFGDKVAIYVDGGEIRDNIPSKIIKVDDSGEIIIVRD